MRLGLYFHTVRHLRPVQVRYQLQHRLSRARAPRPLVDSPQTRRGLDPLPFLSAARGAVGPDFEFQFLNVRYRSAEGGIDWAPAALSKLWRYNLHYFDYLGDDTLGGEHKQRLIDDWIRNNPPGTPDAWEPYPVSLRIVNWVKYFLLLSKHAAPPTAWLESLYWQAAWLERRFEYHLLANHLLKNTVALLFAGAFFQGSAADRWLQRGWRSFAEQMREQFLPDGGHYERSPMYHSICLADCLDVLALARMQPLLNRTPERAQLEQVILRAARFLRDVCLPDGQIALLNDSAFGIAPEPRVLLDRSHMLLDKPRGPARGPDRPGCELIDKAQSGYFGFRHGEDMLLVDCGPIGPDYQPGHAHCDALSYELALEGKRLIVDSGVHDYEPGSRRQLSRGTAGHNTVMLDDQEQSEIWGTFRVARRARPLFASIRPAGEGCIFEGAHDGYRRLSGAPIHTRRIVYDGGGVIEVEDLIEGQGEHQAASRIRVHPDFEIVMQERCAQIVRRGGSVVARVELAPTLDCQLETGHYFPQFGVDLDCDVLVLRTSGRLPFKLNYRIRKAAPS
jgi:uncharacterized heparinase superfamily protein